MKELILNDGNKIPILGFGTYKSTNEEGTQAVMDAIATGYRLLDTAAKYENEKAVGEGIINSGVDRKEIVVTTKLWRENMGYQETKNAFADSLKKLKLNYIDLYLIHWPSNAKNYADWQKINADCWRAMEELQADGKIKSMGVSNFWPEHLEALLQRSKTIPAVNQIEFHPGYWQKEVVDYCKKYDIAVQAWSPLARGKVFKNETLKNISLKFNKSVAQICLRWIIQQQVIAIPKSTTLSSIKENIEIFDFTLEEEDMKTISSLPEMGFSGELPNEWPDRIMVDE